MKKQTFENLFSVALYKAQQEGSQYFSSEDALHVLYHTLALSGVDYWTRKDGGIVAILNGHPALLGYCCKAQYGHEYLDGCLWY